MIIKCYRCDKDIDTPNPGDNVIPGNADYIIAPDTVVREPRDCLIAIKHTQATLKKEAKMKEVDSECILKYPDLKLEESEYSTIVVSSIKDAVKQFGKDLVRVVAEQRYEDVQKTAIICPECYKPTDTLIWGTHKRTLLGNPNFNH